MKNNDPFRPCVVKYAAFIIGQSPSTAKRKLTAVRIKLGRPPGSKINIGEFCKEYRYDQDTTIERLRKEFGKL